MQRIERVDFFDLRPQGSYLRGNQPVSYVTTRPRGQRRVDGVESPHHRTGAATEARRVDGVGRLNSDFHTGSYDVVVCALVLNCLPDAAARGRMVAGLVAHLRPGGLCFLVVPRSCLERSAATTPARFDAVLRRAGLVELERRATRGSAPPPRRRRGGRGARRRPSTDGCGGEAAEFDVVAASSTRYLFTVLLPRGGSYWRPSRPRPRNVMPLCCGARTGHRPGAFAVGGGLAGGRGRP